MEHICYMNRKKLDAFVSSSRVTLLMSDRQGRGKVCQIFENDRVYLVSKQKPRMIVWEAFVQSVEKLDRDKEKNDRQIEGVYYVDFWTKWSQSQLAIRIQLLKRLDLPLEGSNRLFSANWEAVGHLFQKI